MVSVFFLIYIKLTIVMKLIVCIDALCMTAWVIGFTVFKLFVLIPMIKHTLSVLNQNILNVYWSVLLTN